MIRTLVAVVAVLACAGCSGAPSTDANPPAAERTGKPQEPVAHGPTISGKGYTYNVPKGWGRPPQAVPGFNPDSLAMDLRDSDGFSDNVNVIVSPAGRMTPAEAEAAAENELRSFDAKNISINDRVTVAGAESVHITAEFSLNGLKYIGEQFYLSDDDRTLVVTFSFSLNTTPRERAKVTDAVLASWAWTE